MHIARSARFGLIVFVASALALAVLLHEPPRPAPRKDKPGEAAEFFVAQRVGPGETLSIERYERALERRAAMAQANASRAKFGASPWRPVGPTGVGGRTRALLIDPVAPDTLYAGGVSGGVWKSTDGGRNWTPTGHAAMANLAVTSLAMDPSDRATLYAGTGEGVYVGRPVTRSRGVKGAGIFVSRDAGRTWRQLAATRTPQFEYVNRLAFDGAGRLHAATQGGLFVTSDAGATWHAGLAPGEYGCAELAFVPPARMLATCGVHTPASMYTSDDGGLTWRQSAIAANAGRTTIAVAPSNPQVVYTLTARRPDNAFGALRRSDDGGTTWRTVLERATADPLTQRLLSNPLAETDEQCNLLGSGGTGQGWFDNVIAIDPLDPDIVFAGGVDLFRSDDGGVHFRLLSRWSVEPGRPDYVHADQHALVFDPGYDGAANQRVYAANDGGVFVTEQARGPTTDAICGSGGTPVWASRNGGYQVTQFYDGTLSGDGSVAMGGLQDNGTQRGTTLAAPWREVFGGDGGYSAIDPRDASRYYVSTPYGYFLRTDDDGATFAEVRTGLPTDIGSYLFIAPFALDPNDPDVLWTGAGARVYRSANRGTAWQPTSAAIAGVAGPPSALAIATGDSTRVAVGYEQGAIATSRDRGATWTVAVPRAGFVSSLTFDPVDRERIYATYATFGGSHVYVSTDGGATFAPLDGASAAFALPDAPAHTLLVDPRDRSRLWLGTDVGLFTSPDLGQRWYADASGLGSVLIEELLVGGSGADADLVAFTYGRGVHRARLSALGSSVPFNAGYTGAWYDTAVPGQGLLFEAIPQVGELAVGWYTFDADGAGSAWLVGNGPLAGTRATIPLYVVPSGRFDGTENEPVALAGELVVDFTDCTHATATYTVELRGVQRNGTIALTRLTSPAYCDAFRARGDGAASQLPAPANAGDLEYGHGGLWADDTAQRQGFVIDVDPGTRTVFGGWYTYDPLVPRNGAGAPTWYAVQGTLDGRDATLTVYRTSGGRFATPTALTTTAVGTVTLRAIDCLRLEAGYTLTLTDGSTRTGTFALSRIAAPTVCEAMAP